MGNVNDRNDPYYSSQAGWVWEPQMGSWINISGPNAGGPATPAPAAPEPKKAVWGENGYGVPKRPGEGVKPPSNSTATVGGKPAPPPTSPTQVKGSGSGITDKGRFGVDMGTADTGPEGSYWMGQLTSMQDKLGKRQAPQVDQTQANQIRDAQTKLIADLQNQAAGIGPSLAQAQLSKASDQNLANTIATIQSTRGMGATAAAGQAQGAGAQAGQQLAQDSAILQLQEQMQARGMLGQLATGTRGQDLGVAAQNAQLEMQNQQQIADLTMQGVAKGIDWATANRDARIKVAGMNQQAGIQQATLDQNQAQFNRAQGAKEAQAAAEFFLNLLKSIMGGMGGAAGAGAVTGG